MDAWIIVVIALVVLAAVAVAAWLIFSRQRSEQLRGRFGPEYEQTVAEQGGRRRGEAVLQDRVARVEGLSIRPLSREARSGFQRRWDDVQAKFVDDPSGAVGDADSLVAEVMSARGYPVANFEQRAADVSVDHPRVVANYREGHALYLAARDGNATTDQLRTGFVAYRSLFEELLQPDATDGRTPRDIAREERRRSQRSA
jgi:hypothetical protein